MKRLSTILIAALAFFLIETVDASYSKISVRSFDNAPLSIDINHHKYGVSNKLVVEGLMHGIYPVRIYKHIPSHRGHVVRKVLVYQGNMRIPFSSFISFRLTPGNRLMVNETIELRPSSHIIVREKNSRVGVNSHHHKHSKHYSSGYALNSYHIEKISPRQFSRLVERLNYESFDSHRLEIALEALEFNTMSSNQIFEIAMMFKFESNRLKFAKRAYERCIDTHNYDYVFDSFQYTSSKRELDRYIFAMNR